MSHIDSISTDKDSIYQLIMRLDAFNFLHLTPFDDLKLLARFINNASHSTHTIAHLALEKMARKFKEDKGLENDGNNKFIFASPRFLEKAG